MPPRHMGPYGTEDILGKLSYNKGQNSGTLNRLYLWYVVLERTKTCPDPFTLVIVGTMRILSP